MSPDGLVTLKSAFGPEETLDRLVSAVRRYGMRVFHRIDHAAAAKEKGLELRPAEVVIFGNPKGGTKLMRLVPTLSIDLPLKALVWQDDANATWLSYNEPAWFARRHGATEVDPETIVAMTHALAQIAKAATDRALG